MRRPTKRSGNGKILFDEEGLAAGSGDPHGRRGSDIGTVHVDRGAGRPLLEVLVLALLLVVMHRGWEPPHLLLWVGSYLDDVLCLPVVLGVVLAFLRWFRQRPDLTLPVGLGLATLVLYAGWFELVQPRLSSRATADPLDAVAYAVGLVLFMAFINRPAPAGRERNI